jgi:hypothetical protein
MRSTQCCCGAVKNDQSMTDAPNVYVINLSGGIPSALIERALRQLPTFARIRACGTTYSRAYVTNACPTAALHDAIADAPLGAMNDNAAHSWSVTQRPSRTIFDAFLSNGYSTELRGALGIDDSMNPHRVSYTHSTTPADRMRSLGIGEFDEHDAAFLPCQLARVHDERACAAAAASIARSRPTPHFLLLSLLGCRDLLRCGDNEQRAVAGIDLGKDGISTSYPGWAPAYPPVSDHERLFATNVLKDDVNVAGSRASLIPPLVAQARLDSLLHGGAPRDVPLFVRRCHDFAWNVLRSIDVALAQVLAAIDDRGHFARSVIVLTATATIAMREHGAMASAPWEGCCRSFLIVKSVGQNDAAEATHPVSLGVLAPTLMSEVGICADWHMRPNTTTPPVTLFTAPSAVANASLVDANPATFPCFFVRVVVDLEGVIFAVVWWFSIATLATAAELPDAATALKDERTEWPNPVIGRPFVDIVNDDSMHMMVYRTSSDAEELHDLSRDDYWLQSSVADKLLTVTDTALRQLHPSLPMHLPTNATELTPMQCAQCCVQSPSAIASRMVSPDDDAAIRAYFDSETAALLRAKGFDASERLSHSVFLAAQEDDITHGDLPSPVPVIGIEHVTGLVATVDGGQLHVRRAPADGALRVGDFEVCEGGTAAHITAAGHIVKYRVRRVDRPSPQAASAARGSARHVRRRH